LHTLGVFTAPPFNSINVVGSEVVEQWYSEIKDYDFKGHTSGLKTGELSEHNSKVEQG